MSKYFKNSEELSKYIIKKFYDFETLENSLCYCGPTDEEIVSALIEDGYTDLNNLVEDGHGYEIGGYTNNGWLYEDEADIEYMKDHGSKRELRKRDKSHHTQWRSI